MAINMHSYRVSQRTAERKHAYRIFISTSSFAEHDPEPLRLLRQHGVHFELNPYRRRMNSHEIVDFIRDAEGLIAGTEPLDREVLLQAKRLKVISRCGTGLDNVDMEAARELGIVVTNTPTSHVDAVAELTLGAILALIRKISYADRCIRQGDWHKPMGQLLKGSVVGIIGLGKVGRRLVELLTPFHTTVIAYDSHPDYHFASRYQVEMYSLEDLLQYADIVSIHLPYSAEVHHLLNSQRIAQMKPGAFLINTSRGGIVDEAALYDSLNNGRLAGAYIDTFEKEPYHGPLTHLANVLLTPHIGSYAKESRIRMETEAVQNLLAVLKGGHDIERRDHYGESRQQIHQE